MLHQECCKIIQSFEYHGAEQQTVCSDLVAAARELKKASNYFSDAREFKTDHEEKPLTAETSLTILGVGADALKKANII